MNHRHHGGQLRAALALTAVFATVELVGGWLAHSLALMADAVHMTSDVVALMLAVLAQRIAKRPAHAGMTFGYGRARVLAAQANGLALWFVSGWIAWEAFGRLTVPPTVHGGTVLAIASIGLIINLVVLHWLHDSEELNTRAAYWHVLGDALGSVAAILAGLVILASGWMAIDPLLSFVVVAILVFGGWKVVRQSTLELMAGVPRGMALEHIAALLSEDTEVSGAHHLHVWTLPDGRLALSAHVHIRDMHHWPRIMPDIMQRLHAIGIEHTTLQPEVACPDAADQNCHETHP